MKLLEVQSTKEFASTFLNDIFFKMAVNRVLDAAPGFELVRCKECKYYNVFRLECHNAHMNGTIGIDGFCSYGEKEDNV